MGCYIQTSISTISIKECFDGRSKLILFGCTPNDESTKTSNKNNPVPESWTEKTFPSYENLLTDDSADTRQAFSPQAIGFKTTVGLKKESYSFDFNAKFEVGVAGFQIIFHSDSWMRMARFFLNEEGGGFNPHWFSGDWSKMISPDILLNPSIFPFNSIYNTLSKMLLCKM